MDIALLSMSMSQSRVQDQIGVSIMKKAMDNGTEQAGRELDLLMPAIPGLGETIDIQA
ncbi:MULTISPECIES: YjfB family protein [Sporomusaceae]|uniref:YjfB family protein n=1 Tax=Sporomusaceae TaxID=1843490 RepID=UPI0003653514|nr:MULTISPECIES: YjfB family protein [Sporomusaceae]